MIARNQQLAISERSPNEANLGRVTWVSSCSNSSSNSLSASECFYAVEVIPPSKFWPSDSRSPCFKRKRPRPDLNPLGRLFWTALRHCWSRRRNAVVQTTRDARAPFWKSTPGSQSGTANAWGGDWDTRRNPQPGPRGRRHTPARMRLSRDPTAVDRDDNRNLPQGQTRKAVMD